MKYTTLGNSGIKISQVCLGCMGFGVAAQGQHSWTKDEQDSLAIIKRALELGVNFFDTAIVYQGGTSEQFVGKALGEYAKRDEIVVATKFPRMPKEMADAGMSGQKYVETMLDRSLANLGMDYVDLYILHRWDYTTPLYEIMEGLNNAVKAGKTRAIGVSNCYAYQLAKANALAEKEGFAKFVSIQGHYSLIAREEEREMAKLCAEDGITMTPYSPLAGGRLARLPGETTARLEQDAYAKNKYGATEEKDADIIRRVHEVAEKRGVSMTEVALAWLISKGAVPVTGATKMSHIEGGAASAELELTADECAYLEELYVPHEIVGVLAQNK